MKRASEQMKRIVITLEWALLTHLRYVEGDDARLGILALLSASDDGRARTISVSRDLLDQRLAQSAVILRPIAAEPAVADPSSGLG